MKSRRNPSRSNPSIGVALAVAVGVVGWTGCSSEHKPITAATSKYEAADESSQPAASRPAEPATMPGAVSPNTATQTAGDAPDTRLTAPPGSGEPAQPGTPSGESTAAAAGAAGSTPAKPSATPPATLPADGEDDATRQLLDQLQALQQRDPRGATREETISNLTSAQQQISELADKILAAAKTESTLVRAAHAKIQALTFLAQVQPDADARLNAFVANLKQHSNPQLVRLARHLEFAQQMQAFSNGQNTDAEKLLSEFKKVFDEQPKDASLFQLSQQVTEIFLQKGMSKEAGEVMQLVADTYAKNADPQLANAAKMVAEQKAIIDVDLDSKINALLEKKPNAGEDFLAAIDKLFAQGQVGDMTHQFLGQILPFIESQDMELADKMITKLGQAAEGKEGSESARIKEMAENFAKRKALIGKPFVVEGVTVEGKPFDWSAYEGKVVLVDFWATWCRPCLEEIPNITDNYEKYREQGFEVVGVNIDENPEDVQRFFSRQKLPWVTVVSADPEKQGFQNPLLVNTGAEGIPFLVLIGRDGNVIRLNPRGPELGKQLAALFDAPSSDKTDNPLRSEKSEKKEESKSEKSEAKDAAANDTDPKGADAK